MLLDGDSERGEGKLERVGEGQIRHFTLSVTSVNLQGGICRSLNYKGRLYLDETLGEVLGIFPFIFIKISIYCLTLLKFFKNYILTSPYPKRIGLVFGAVSENRKN